LHSPKGRSRVKVQTHSRIGEQWTFSMAVVARIPTSSSEMNGRNMQKNWMASSGSMLRSRGNRACQKYMCKIWLRSIQVLSVNHLSRRKVRHPVYKMTSTLTNTDSGHVYICGDARNMARDVEAVLVKILGNGEGSGQGEGEKELRLLKDRKRIALDVW